MSNQLFGFVSENSQLQKTKEGGVKKRLMELKELLNEGLIDNQVYIEKEKEILKNI